MKKILALVLALCMVFALAACGQQKAPATSTQPSTDTKPATQSSTVDQLIEQGATEVTNEVTEEANGYIREKLVVTANSVTSLTPWGTNNSTPGNYEVYEMIYECDAKGQIYPLLADASYEGNFMYQGELLPGCDHEDGSAVYDVHIYDCIYDHNGNHVDASDVAFSYNWQLTNEAVSGWNDLVSIEALDATTVRFTFTGEIVGVGGLTDIFCRCFIVDEESFNASSSQLVNEMCGTGPYKFVSYTGSTEVVMERYEDYWQLKAGMTPRQEQQANVKTVVMKFVDEGAQKVIGLETGDLDCVPEIDADSATKFADGGEYGDKYNVKFYQAKFVNYIVPNCDPASIMSDLNMRLAVLNAIDQDGLILATGGNDSRLYAYACDYYNDYSYVDWEGMDNYNTRTGVDPDQVKGYLDAAGYKGQKLTIITAGAADQATVVAAQLAAVGINAEVKALDFTSARTVEGDPTQWDLNMGMMAGDNMAVVWQHGFGVANTGTGKTSNYVDDPVWNELLDTCNTMVGHTPENMLAWWQHAVDNAYCMGLWAGKQFMVLPEDMTGFVQGDKLTFLPGACTFEAP